MNDEKKILIEDRETATRELFQALEDLGASYQPYDLVMLAFKVRDRLIAGVLQAKLAELEALEKAGTVGSLYVNKTFASFVVMLAEQLKAPTSQNVTAEHAKERISNDWTTLDSLTPGAIFETRAGTLAVKSDYRYPNGGWNCVLLASGEYAHFSKDGAEHNRVEVREVGVGACVSLTAPTEAATTAPAHTAVTYRLEPDWRPFQGDQWRRVWTCPLRGVLTAAHVYYSDIVHTWSWYVFWPGESAHAGSQLILSSEAEAKDRAEAELSKMLRGDR